MSLWSLMQAQRYTMRGCAAGSSRLITGSNLLNTRNQISFCHFFWEEFLSQKQLLQLRDEGTRGFYFRPRYLLREIRKLSNISELKRKAKMAASLFQSSVMGVGHSLYSKGPQLKNTRTSGAGGYANNKANPYSVRE